MTQLYVKEQGARVSKRGERLVIKKGHEVIDEVPMTRVNQLVVMGNVQVSTQTLAALSAREIDVIYLTSRGKYRGSWEGHGSPRVTLRQSQLRKFEDEAFCLRLAQQVVDSKINNQRIILQRQAQRMTSSGFVVDRTLFQRGLAGMQQMQRQAVQASSLDTLRGYEGKAGAYYFEAVRSLLNKAWGFERREYFPPPDPFNALLSFSYALVTKDVYAAVQQIGLDPYLGFFHAVGRGRPSLALDLMEEWRPVIADGMALELVNRRMLTPGVFEQTNNPRRPIQLGEDGVALVLQAYESRLGVKHFHPLAGPGGNATLRTAIKLQARQLSQVISGDRPKFEPFKIK